MVVLVVDAEGVLNAIADVVVFHWMGEQHRDVDRL